MILFYPLNLELKIIEARLPNVSGCWKLAPHLYVVYRTPFTTKAEIERRRLIDDIDFLAPQLHNDYISQRAVWIRISL